MSLMSSNTLIVPETFNTFNVGNVMHENVSHTLTATFFHMNSLYYKAGNLANLLCITLI